MFLHSQVHNAKNRHLIGSYDVNLTEVAREKFQTKQSSTLCVGWENYIRGATTQKIYHKDAL